MKTGSSKMRNMIVSHGVDGSHAAKLLKEAWRAFSCLLNMDHLLRRKKRSSNHGGINILMNSTSTVPTLDSLSQDMNSHEAAAGHNNFTDLSLMIERIRDGGGASGRSGGYSVSNTVSVEEVDELADAFISRFYNNMRLEKQQSYGRYQEMLARGT